MTRNKRPIGANSEPRQKQRSSVISQSDQISLGIQLLLLGVLPVIGLWFFGWSANEWVLFFVFGAWFGLICDSIKYYFLQRQIRHFDQLRAIGLYVDNGRTQKQNETTSRNFKAIDPIVGVILSDRWGDTI